MVKVGNCFSTPHKVFGGVPQGSILGIFLFNCGIDSFKATFNDMRHYTGGTGEETTVEGGPDDLPVLDEPVDPDYRHLPLCGELILNKC